MATYTYCSFKPCGCLAWAAADAPLSASHVAKMVKESVSEGLPVERLEIEEFRRRPMTCEKHKEESRSIQRRKALQQGLPIPTSKEAGQKE